MLKEVMLLCYIDGQLFTDISKHLGLTASQVLLMYNKGQINRSENKINVFLFANIV